MILRENLNKQLYYVASSVFALFMTAVTYAQTPTTMTRDVWIGNPKWTTYDIPGTGAELTLNVNRGNLVNSHATPPIAETHVRVQDESDDVQWMKIDALCSGDLHVYKTMDKISSSTTKAVMAGHEWVAIAGKCEKAGASGSGHGSGVSLPAYTFEVGALSLELKDGGTVVKEDDLVYISAAPVMPQLKAKLKPDGLTGSVAWSLTIEFKKTNRDDEDVLTKTVAASAEWDIAHEFGSHFYGGKATLTATYQGIVCTRIFHIRGYNPTEAAAATEIGNSPFYTKAIARHESGTQVSRTYLQFNQLGTTGPDYLADITYTPNRSSDQKGWGMYQLTSSPNRDQVWSWKANVAAGKVVMNNNLSEAPWYFQAIQRKYPTEYEAPPATYTPPGTTTALTYIQAAAIQMFNGSSVVEFLPNPTPPGGSSYFRSCWKFNPSNPAGRRWSFVPNVNDYVLKIIKEYEKP